jgi:HAD superfamily hydrolase (TIGR01509 family)
MTPKPGAALLFDIDGTLADTDALHLQAFNTVFAPFGRLFSRDQYMLEIQGFSNAAISARFLPEETLERRVELINAKESTFRALAGRGLEPMPGLFDLLDFAERHGIRKAAVTNAPRANASLIINGLGIAHRFETIIIGEELAHGKPHPLPYLEGLRALGADASSSLAFEDSRSGVRSATAAGIATVGITSSLAAAELIEAGAVDAIAGFSDPAVMHWISARLMA